MNRVLRYLHWAGFSDRTSPFGFAIAYVFIKQLEPPGHCDLLSRESRHPFSRSYGANLPISLSQISSVTPWPSQPGAPVSDLGTIIQLPFHGLLGSADLRHHSLPRFSPLRHSTGLSCLNGATTPLGLPGSVGFSAGWYRNINLFPFRACRLRTALRID